jgi:YidC/Oxa1 family membrane protein insertase
VWYALLGVLEEITRWSPSQGQPSYGLTVPIVQDALHARIFGVSIADTFLHTPGTHVKVVIAIVVVCSAVTTFLTVRQSMKRGMMQTPTVDADNPMAGAQKYMAYIAPLFALSGLYWQFGLVIYWLASNLWTLGQQYFLFKKIPPLNVAAADATAGAAVAAAPRVKQVTATAAKRASAGARPAAPGKAQAAGSKQPASGAKQPAGTARRPAAQKTAGAKPAAQRTPAGKPAAQRTPAGKPAAQRTPATGKPAAAKSGGAAAAPAAAPNGSGGVLRKLVGKRAEPAPEPEPPEVTVVRQQRTKQSRSKRTGKR